MIAASKKSLILTLYNLSNKNYLIRLLIRS